MKRIIIALIIGCCLWSCTNNSIDESIARLSKEPIRFSTLRSLLQSRYANENKNDYQIYGYIEGQTSTDWFINSLVTPNVGGDSTDLVHDGTYYWLGDGRNMYFYAFAPDESVDGVNSVTTSSTSSIEIEFQVPATAQQDFTIAIPVIQNSGQVKLQFQHMLSLISTNVVLSDELTAAGYSLGYYTATVQVAYDINTINAVYDGSTNAMSSWSSSPKSSASDYIIDYMGVTAYMILPQTFTPTTVDSTTNETVLGSATVQISDLTINLTVNGNSSTVFSGNLLTYGFADGVIPDNSFYANRKYNLNFTITSIAKDSNSDNVFGGAVTFNPSVAEWATD